MKYILFILFLTFGTQCMSQDIFNLIYVDSPELTVGMSEVKEQILNVFKKNEKTIVYFSNDKSPLIAESLKEFIARYNQMSSLNPGRKRTSGEIENLNNIIRNEKAVYGISISNPKSSYDQCNFLFFTSKNEYENRSFEENLLKPLLLSNRILENESLRNGYKATIMIINNNALSSSIQKTANYFKLLQINL